MTDPLTALLKGETLYSPADKIYVSLYKKSRDGNSGHVGQLMIAHDGYREYNGGDFGPISVATIDDKHPRRDCNQ